MLDLPNKQTCPEMRLFHHHHSLQNNIIAKPLLETPKMLKKGKNWDCSPRFMRHEDQHGSNTSLHQLETTDMIAWDEKQDIQYDNDMVSDGNHEDRTSETINLLSVDEDADKERSPGGKWPPLKKHKNVVLYQWTGLSKKPSFLKKMTKGDKEEKTALVSEVKKAKNNQSKTEDACQGVSHEKMSKLNYMMESLKRRSSKTSVNTTVSCPVVGSLPEDRQGPEWAENVSVGSYFMQKVLDLSEQLPEEETSQYLNALPKADQDQVAHAQLEKSNQPIYAEIAHLQISQEELLEIEQHHFTNQLNMLKKTIDEEKNVNSPSVYGLQNSSTRLIPSEESAADACTVQDMAPSSYDGDLSSILNPTSAFEETSSPLEGAPITGSVDRKCCNTEAFMKEITAVKNRQDFLETECLQLRNRYYSDNNIIMELLREHHIRCSQLLVDMNDLREQQITAIVNMKEAILFTEEKMAYQSFERARDIWDEMRIFQSHISNIEAVQKRQNRPASVNEAKNYSKVMNLIVTNITRGKVMANCLPIILTVLLLCLFIHVILPFMTTPFYTTLIFVALLWYGVLHNWSLTLQGSWVGTHVTHFFNRLVYDYDFLSAFEEAREQFFGG